MGDKFIRYIRIRNKYIWLVRVLLVVVAALLSRSNSLWYYNWHIFTLFQVVSVTEDVAFHVKVRRMT